jgi:hypothetical protein
MSVFDQKRSSAQELPQHRVFQKEQNRDETDLPH